MGVIITLTTDFGLKDHYVGTMKGVLLSRCPTATIADISHQVTPFSIWEGAYTIAQSAPFFPPGTIHVVVVDPGVGTSRKAILVEARNQIFIAPDNGVLSFFLKDASSREITNRSLFLPALSSTFHGRDVFSAVAAAVASGVPVDEVGPAIPNPIELAGLQPETAGDNRWIGRVFSVDHFGNVITNLRPEQFRNATIETARGVVSKRHATFAEAQTGEVFLYSGSSGFIEIGVNQGSAAQSLGLRAGDSIRVVC